jgi:hypothetical protein
MTTLTSICIDNIKAGWESWIFCKQLMSGYTIAPGVDETEALQRLEVSLRHVLNEEESDTFMYWMLWIKETEGTYNTARAFWFTGDRYRNRKREFR